MADVMYTAPDGTRTRMSPADAMRQHAADKFRGNIENIKETMEVPTTIATTVVTTATPESAEARIARHADALNAAGFALPAPMFAAGTSLIQYGKDKYRALAVDHAGRPMIEDALRETATRIQMERRQDATIPLRALRMQADGTVTRGKEAIALEPMAFNQLLTMANSVLPSARALMHHLDPALRAEVWNAQVQKLPDDAAVKVGVRRGSGGWQLYRALSTTYPTGAPANVVMGRVADALHGRGMRGSVVYDPETTRVSWDAAWMAPQEIDPRVGDVFRVGVLGGTADAANGSFYSKLGITRILCVNLTTADAYAQAYRRAHRGDLTTVADQMGALANASTQVFEGFAKDWQILRTRKIGILDIDGEHPVSVPDAIEKLVERGDITKEIGRDAQVEALLSAWRKEPGDTLADLINAVSRAAHEADWQDFQRKAMEERAGELVHVLAA